MNRSSRVGAFAVNNHNKSNNGSGTAVVETTAKQTTKKDAEAVVPTYAPSLIIQAREPFPTNIIGCR
jgi:hypothetical protein